MKQTAKVVQDAEDKGGVVVGYSSNVFYSYKAHILLWDTRKHTHAYVQRHTEISQIIRNDAIISCSYFFTLEIAKR